MFESLRNKTRALLERLTNGAGQAGSDVAVSKQELEELLGVTVDELALYEQALTHRSVLRDTGARYIESNERLEFLGDAVLGMLVFSATFAASILVPDIEPEMSTTNTASRGSASPKAWTGGSTATTV